LQTDAAEPGNTYREAKGAHYDAEDGSWLVLLHRRCTPEKREWMGLSDEDIATICQSHQIIKQPTERSTTPNMMASKKLKLISASEQITMKATTTPKKPPTTVEIITLCNHAKNGVTKNTVLPNGAKALCNHTHHWSCRLPALQ